jgi:hypothetical protein
MKEKQKQLSQFISKNQGKEITKDNIDEVIYPT